MFILYFHFSKVLKSREVTHLPRYVIKYVSCRQNFVTDIVWQSKRIIVSSTLSPICAQPDQEKVSSVRWAHFPLPPLPTSPTYLEGAFSPLAPGTWLAWPKKGSPGSNRKRPRFKVDAVKRLPIIPIPVLLLSDR